MVLFESRTYKRKRPMASIQKAQEWLLGPTAVFPAKTSLQPLRPQTTSLRKPRQSLRVFAAAYASTELPIAR